MAIYEYACETCRVQIEEMKPTDQRDEIPHCVCQDTDVECGMKRVHTRVNFKINGHHHSGKAKTHNAGSGF